MRECKHGCGYTHHHAGTMNLHETMHCKVIKNVPKKTVPVPLEWKNCEHQWEMINPQQSEKHNMAYQDGYREVCTKCLAIQ